MTKVPAIALTYGAIAMVQPRANLLSGHDVFPPHPGNDRFACAPPRYHRIRTAPAKSNTPPAMRVAVMGYCGTFRMPK